MNTDQVEDAKAEAERAAELTPPTPEARLDEVTVAMSNAINFAIGMVVQKCGIKNIPELANCISSALVTQFILLQCSITGDKSDETMETLAIGIAKVVTDHFGLDPSVVTVKTKEVSEDPGDHSR